MPTTKQNLVLLEKVSHEQTESSILDDPVDIDESIESDDSRGEVDDSLGYEQTDVSGDGSVKLV